MIFECYFAKRTKEFIPSQPSSQNKTCVWSIRICIKPTFHTLLHGSHDWSGIQFRFRRFQIILISQITFGSVVERRTSWFWLPGVLELRRTCLVSPSIFPSPSMTMGGGEGWETRTYLCSRGQDWSTLYLPKPVFAVTGIWCTAKRTT